ncbi:VENN motif pre-toxin domain-containing protein [Acinetobacter proteolyticus]|nr:VENN motif pre-toxin domain-containing protein [Acinetobacter proteolyticus]WEI18140.1 VENN motif pre-toxin domain-containing protein [Acinetobacter proteolyticus]
MEDMVSAGLSAPTASGAGIAASTLSPAASYEIGQYFKGKDAEGSAAHILAHTILGAAVAATGGNNALSAGISAGGAEAAAPLLAEYLYGKKAKDLTASEKSTISSIVGLAGSAVGATTGDVSSTVQGGQSAQNAVENNYLTVKQIDEFNREMKDCKKNNNCSQTIEKYKNLSITQDETLSAICSIDAVLCKEKYGFIINAREDIKKQLDRSKDIPGLYQQGLLSQQIQAEGIVFNQEIARQLKVKFNITDEQAQLLAMAASGVAGSKKIVKGNNKPNNMLPVADAIVANNNLTYKSNSKHTLGGVGNRPNAGIEPKNSLELFEKSIPIGGNSNKRFTLDSNGNVHQFTYEGTGSNTYHWAGSTGDSRNPLILDNKTKAILRKNGWSTKVLK